MTDDWLEEAMQMVNAVDAALTGQALRWSMSDTRPLWRPEFLAVAEKIVAAHKARYPEQHK